MSPEMMTLLNTGSMIILAIVTIVGNRQTHRLVNSRMSEMLELAKKNWRQGREEEEEKRTKKTTGL